MTRAGGYQEPTTNKPPEKPEILFDTNPYIPYRTDYNTKQEFGNRTDRDVWKTDSSRWAKNWSASHRSAFTRSWGLHLAIRRSISDQVMKGGFSSSFGKTSPLFGKTVPTIPMWTAQFQAARKLASSLRIVVGLKGLPPSPFLDDLRVMCF